MQFRLQILHYTSLMHACAMADMRQDDNMGPPLSTIAREDPFIFKPHRDLEGLPVGAAPATKMAGAKMAGEDGLPPPAKTPSRRTSLLSSGGRSQAPDLKGRSNRATTVPLQMLLRTRHQMQEQMGAAVNSFEAIDAMEKAVRPISVASSDGMTARAPEREKTQLKRGSISSLQFIKTVVLKIGNAKVHSHLLTANSFEVLGGVCEVSACACACVCGCLTCTLLCHTGMRTQRDLRPIEMAPRCDAVCDRRRAERRRVARRRRWRC